MKVGPSNAWHVFENGIIGFHRLAAWNFPKILLLTSCHLADLVICRLFSEHHGLKGHWPECPEMLSQITLLISWIEKTGMCTMCVFSFLLDPLLPPLLQLQLVLLLGLQVAARVT